MRPLQRVPEMRETCLFVDRLGKAKAQDRNASSMRTVVEWVRAGGALIVFPSGKVSHTTLRARAPTDGPWDPMLARLLRLTQAPALPVLFHGHNGWGFQLAGLLHPRLRTLLLPRQLLNKRGQTVRFRVGSPVSFSELEKIGNDEAITAYLRMRTYLLEGHDDESAADDPPPVELSRPAPLVDSVPPSLLAAEVAALPPERLLVQRGQSAVYYARGSEVPRILREIGRLREKTFRDVGQGTGGPIDLQERDAYYLHLFHWDGEKNEIMGAYRMGATDEILPDHGKDGLYTSRLFEYDDKLVEEIDPALELGRAFVRQEQQRSYMSLYLLWRGIGQFVARHPWYRHLFGAVSISSDYPRVSKQLMLDFLRMNRGFPEKDWQVRAKYTPRLGDDRHWDSWLFQTSISNVQQVDELVRESDPDDRGIPILLRQYLELNARVLAFGESPHFGNALDALILVDLLDVEPSLRARYMGKEQAEAFLSYHGRLAA